MATLVAVFLLAPPALADPFAVTFSANPEQGTAPLTVRFTDTSQYSVTWNWSFGDGTTSTEQNPVHVYRDAGVYPVRMTALTGMLEPFQERSAQATIVVETPAITVVPDPVLVLSPASGEAGTPVTVTGSSFTVPAGEEFPQVAITFDGERVAGDVSLEGSAFSASFVVPANAALGDHTVRASGPLKAATATFTVIENTPEIVPDPILVVSPTSGEAGTTVTVTGSSFDTRGSEFPQAVITFDGERMVPGPLWIEGGAFSTSFAVPRNALPGAHTVRASGPKNAATATFTVIPETTTVVPDPVLSLSPASGLAGTVVTVTGSSFTVPAGTEFPQAAITFDGERVAGYVPLENNGFSASFTVPAGAAPGEHTVRASAYSGAATATFTVVSSPTPTTPPVTVPPPVLVVNPVASGYAVTVDGSVTPGAAGATITRVAWDWGDGASGGGPVPQSHTYAAAGSYAITVTAYQSDGQSTSRTLPVSISGPSVTTTEPPTTTAPPAGAPIAAFTWTPAATNRLRVQFADESSGAVTAWRWEFGDGNVSLEQNPFHIYPGPGGYPVHLAVEGPAGVSSARLTVTIGEAATTPPTPTVTATPLSTTLTPTTAVPDTTGEEEPEPFPWWLAAIGAVGLLAGGAAYATLAHGALAAREPPIPGLTVEPRGRLNRTGMGEAPDREAQIEIQVRGGMRRER